jgi:hypothetical protein
MSVFIRCPKIIKISLFVGRYSLVVDYDNHDNYDNSPPGTIRRNGRTDNRLR